MPSSGGEAHASRARCGRRGGANSANFRVPPFNRVSGRHYSRVGPDPVIGPEIRTTRREGLCLATKGNWGALSRVDTTVVPSGTSKFMFLALKCDKSGTVVEMASFALESQNSVVYALQSMTRPLGPGSG